LDRRQEAEVRDLIRRHLPEALGLPFALWSRAAVAALIEQRCGVRLAVRTMGTYLARWGFTPQQPLRRAYEQQPAAVRQWLRHEYPAIVVRARRAGGVIFWGDETGLRADDVRGRSYAPPGKTPLVRPNQHRIGLGLISAVKVFLILDRLPVHRSAMVREWLARHKRQIEVSYLPSYSPELNPDEGLNADLKQNITRRAPIRSKQQLKQATISYMRRLAKSPARVRSFFHQNSMRYTA
jgi:hypothetical protein